MCMVDYAEGPWEVVHEPHQVCARKAHRCGECARTIDRGERYETGTYADGYGLTTVKTCAHCVAVRSWLLVQCGGWLYQGVLDDLEEHWDESWELRGRYLALAISGMRKQWRRSNGSLMRIMGRYRKPRSLAPVEPGAAK